MIRADHRKPVGRSRRVASAHVAGISRRVRRLRWGFGNREGMGAVGFCVALGLIGLKFYARHQRHEEWKQQQAQAQVAAAPAPAMVRGPGANNGVGSPATPRGDFDSARSPGQGQHPPVVPTPPRYAGTPSTPVGSSGTRSTPGVPVRPAEGTATVEQLTSAGFRSATERGIVLVNFCAATSTACQTQEPIVQKVANRVGGSARVAKVDVSTASDLAARFSVRSVPTLIVFADGREAQRFTGVTREESLVLAVSNALQTLPPESLLATSNVDPEPLPRIAPLNDIPLPGFPDLGTARRYEENGETVFSSFDVDLESRSEGPGQSTRLRVYIPAMNEGFERRPLVLVPPAGSNLLHGLPIAELGRDGLLPEHTDYVRAGFVVVAFSVDGPIEDLGTASGTEVRTAYERLVAAHAGVVNARNALAYALAKVPQVDPKRIFVAGRDSAGTLALVFAAHESQLAGCIAYAPISDIRHDLSDKGIQVAAPGFQQAIPGAIEFSRRFSPIHLADRVDCPVFLFHAEDDLRVVVDQSRRLVTRLQSRTGVKFVTVASGGHVETVFGAGIPAAIDWIRGGTPVDAAPNVPGEGTPVARTDGVIPAPRDEKFEALRAFGTSEVSKLRQRAGKLTGTYRDLANRKLFIEILATKDPEGEVGALEFQVNVRFAEPRPGGGYKYDDRGNIVYKEVRAALAVSDRNELVADIGGLTTFVFPSAGAMSVSGAIEGTFSRVRR